MLQKAKFGVFKIDKTSTAICLPQVSSQCSTWPESGWSADQVIMWLAFSALLWVFS